jgi:hypothetical protein
VKRKAISLKVKLAAALVKLGGIPHLDAKGMSADQVISLFEFHHFPIPHAMGGLDVHWNLEVLFRKEHREETRKVTVPTIAKERRVTKKWEDHIRRVNQKGVDEIQGKKRKWPSRPFAKRKGGGKKS